VKRYVWLRSLTLVGICYALAWVVIEQLLIQWSWPVKIVLQTSMLIIIALMQLLPEPKLLKEQTVKPIMGARWRGSKILTLVHWRLAQIIRRNRLTQLCLAAAVA